MDQLTDEQKRQFWERCGLHYNKPTGGFFWDKDDVLVFDMHKGEDGLDLNNLTRYAIPVVLNEHTIIETYNFKQASGLYYSETEIWDRGTTEHGTEVLKGTRVGKAFTQDFDLEKATAMSICLAIYEALGGKDEQRTD